MDLDDELRQLFTSDRLDVPVRADAEEVIVAGARRVRRRRIAAATAGGACAIVVVVAAGIALAGGGPDAMPPAIVNPTTPTSASSVNAGPPLSESTPTGPSMNTATSTSTSTPKPPTTKTKTSDPGPPNLSFPVVGPTGYKALELGQTLEDAQATGLVGDSGTSQGSCTRYELLSDDRASGYVLISDTVQVIAADPVQTPEGVGPGWTVAQVKEVYSGLDEDAATDGHAVVPVEGNSAASFELQFAGGEVTRVTLQLDSSAC